MDIDENMKKFKQDLNNKNLSNEYIIRKYLCNGSSPVLEDEIIFEIKNKIAEKFKIHPNEVIIVGSGKLGFSIAPQKRFKHFNVDSDVDVAIISEKLFDDFWLELLSFNINTTSRTEKEENLYNEFRKYFFKGWLRPDKFPFRYEGKQEWFSFFNTLTRKIHPYGEHRIAAGVFKNFVAFEIYNSENIKNLRISTQEECDNV